MLLNSLTIPTAYLIQTAFSFTFGSNCHNAFKNYQLNENSKIYNKDGYKDKTWNQWLG